MVWLMQDYVEAENFTSDAASLTGRILILYFLYKTSLHLFPLFVMKPVTS